MNINFLLIVLFWASSTSFAQNLVKNPSFEEYYCLPKTQKDFSCVKYWKNVKGDNLTNYCHRNSPVKDNPYFKIPFLYSGFQETRSGDAYIQIVANAGYCVVQGMLIAPLKKDAQYYAEVYLNLADFCMKTTSSFHIAFSDSQFPVKVPMSYYYNLKPQIVNSDSNYIKDKEGWTKISGTFTANGGERFFAMGNFNPSSKLKGGKPEDKDLVAFIIDDMLVCEAKDMFIIEPDKPLVLNNIVFATGKAELLPASFAELDKLQSYLVSNPAVKLEIAGHTDNVGNAAANLSLSQNRAESVRKYLTDKGISPDRLTAKGYGDILPAAANDTPAGRAQNRRVEVKLLK